MAYEDVKRPAWVPEGEQWTPGETQQQFEAKRTNMSPTASVAVRYNEGDPYKMFTNYKNSGGKLDMTSWEGQGRPSGDMAGGNGTTADYYNGLDITAPNEAEQSAIREKTRQDLQTQLDAIDEMYAGLITGEQSAGNERLKSGLGKTRAFASRSGILDSPIGAAQMDQEQKGQTEYTQKNVKALEAERNVRKIAILDKIDARAQATIDAQKAEAKGNFEEWQKYRDSVRSSAKEDATGLAKNNVSLATLKANPEHYNQLLAETGMDNFAFDNWYDSQSPQPTIIDTKFISTPDGKTKAVTIKRDFDGKITSEEQILDMALPAESANYKTQILDDGTVLFVPDKIDPSKPLDSQVKMYGKEGQFAKPITPNSDSDSEWERRQQAVSLSNNFAQANVGSDGKLSPENFIKLRSAWGSDGLDDDDFITNFRKYVNTSRDDYQETYQISAAELYQ